METKRQVLEALVEQVAIMEYWEHRDNCVSQKCDCQEWADRLAARLRQEWLARYDLATEDA